MLNLFGFSSLTPTPVAHTTAPSAAAAPSAADGLLGAPNGQELIIAPRVTLSSLVAESARPCSYACSADAALIGGHLDPVAYHRLSREVLVLQGSALRRVSQRHWETKRALRGARWQTNTAQWALERAEALLSSKVESPWLFRADSMVRNALQPSAVGAGGASTFATDACAFDSTTKADGELSTEAEAARAVHLRVAEALRAAAVQASAAKQRGPRDSTASDATAAAAALAAAPALLRACAAQLSEGSAASAAAALEDDWSDAEVASLLLVLPLLPGATLLPLQAPEALAAEARADASAAAGPLPRRFFSAGDWEGYDFEVATLGELEGKLEAFDCLLAGGSGSGDAPPPRGSTTTLGVPSGGGAWGAASSSRSTADSLGGAVEARAAASGLIHAASAASAGGASARSASASVASATPPSTVAEMATASSPSSARRRVATTPSLLEDEPPAYGSGSSQYLLVASRGGSAPTPASVADDTAHLGGSCASLGTDHELGLLAQQLHRHNDELHQEIALARSRRGEGVGRCQAVAALSVAKSTDGGESFARSDAEMQASQIRAEEMGTAVQRLREKRRGSQHRLSHFQMEISAAREEVAQQVEAERTAEVGASASMARHVCCDDHALAEELRLELASSYEQLASHGLLRQEASRLRRYAYCMSASRRPMPS